MASPQAPRPTHTLPFVLGFRGVIMIWCRPPRRPSSNRGGCSIVPTAIAFLPPSRPDPNALSQASEPLAPGDAGGRDAGGRDAVSTMSNHMMDFTPTSEMHVSATTARASNQNLVEATLELLRRKVRWVPGTTT